MSRKFVVGFVAGILFAAVIAGQAISMNDPTAWRLGGELEMPAFINYDTGQTVTLSNDGRVLVFGLRADGVVAWKWIDPPESSRDRSDAPPHRERLPEIPCCSLTSPKSAPDNLSSPPYAQPADNAP